MEDRKCSRNFLVLEGFCFEERDMVDLLVWHCGVWFALICKGNRRMVVRGGLEGSTRLLF